MKKYFAKLAIALVTGMATKAAVRAFTNRTYKGHYDYQSRLKK